MDVFVARQPIFDRDRCVYGYELLYRSAETQTHFDGTESSLATRQVISSILMSLDFEQILGGKKAFLNFDERLLSDGTYLGLPADATVIEILETVKPSADLEALCRAVREQGYRIALDDFIASPELEPLTRVANLIKVDLRATDRDEQQRLVRTYHPRGIALLAEKVENYEEFEWAKKAGYDYFQGYFFARPAVIKGKQVTAAKATCLRLLSEVQGPELDFKRVESLIHSDVALAYNLLRYVNSAAFARRTEIRSIDRALTIMGTNDVRRWVALTTLPRLATDKPGELATLAILRARFCEQLVELAGIGRQNEAFLVGMFSLLDAMLDCPLNEALGSIALAPAVSGVLLGTVPENDVLRRIYQLTSCYERGDWDEMEQLSRACGFSGADAGAAYVEATLWAEHMLEAVSAASK